MDARRVSEGRVKGGDKVLRELMLFAILYLLII